MAKGPVETADPRQYLRLLLMRLLETQKCLRPLLSNPALAPVKLQFLTNESTLQEIRAWLAVQDSASPLGPSTSSVPSAEPFGSESSEPLHVTSGKSGEPNTPFAWRTFQRTEALTSSQVQSSLPSGITLPPSASVIRGKITFQLPSSSVRPTSISDGTKSTDDDKNK